MRADERKRPVPKLEKSREKRLSPNWTKKEKNMSLRIVYGRSGTGKSTYLFKEIAEKIKHGQKRKIYIITPEQFSFTAEKKLMEAVASSTASVAILPHTSEPMPVASDTFTTPTTDVTAPTMTAVVSAEVLTFNRMAYRVSKEIGSSNLKNLSSSGKAMFLYQILSEEKNNLKFIGKTQENVEMIGTQITEFKKHGITVEQLKQEKEKVQNKYLQTKLQDMLEIYEKYEECIQSEYLDENDNLTRLAETLDLVQEFDDTDIYIDEFVGFTHQEYEILRKLLQKAHQVTITVCTDDIEVSTNPDTDVFYANKVTLDRILQIAKQENCAVQENVCLEKTYRFKASELKHLEQNIYAFPYHQYTEKVENLSLFLAKNQYSEIEYVAEQIVKLVHDKQYRYQDISVITKDLEGYANLCKVIFAKYHIPVFIDEKKDLSQNVLVKYLLAVLNIFAKNWTTDSILEYIKTGLVKEIEEDDVYVIENYAIKWGIKGAKWYQVEWNFYQETEEEQKKILHIREKIIEPLLSLKNALSSSKDVKSITSKLYQFLIENSIQQRLSERIKDLEEMGELEKAKELESSYTIMMNLFDEMVLVLGERKLSFDQYAEILKTGLGNTGLGKIPSTQDQVTVGDVDRSRSHKVRAVFIIGLNDGMFPSVNKNEGFLNDKDRDILKEQGMELAKGTTEQLYDDNFNIYKAFGTAEEKLYLSYSSADIEGKALRPSILRNRVKKIFPNLIEESDVIQKRYSVSTEESTFEALLDKLRDYKEGKEIEDTWLMLYHYYVTTPEWKERLKNSLEALHFHIQPDNLSKELLQKLYGDTLRTSISRLEQYQSCPFSYYLKYGLNLSEKEEFKVQSIDTGTFMHDVIDSFFDKLQERNLDVKTVTQEEIQEIVEEVIEEKLQLKRNYIFTSIPKYKVLANRLKRVIQTSILYIVDSLKYSDFEVMGHEMEFKNGKEYPAIQLQLEDGKKVEITGKIDRIDIAKTPEGNYIRIIDYKSSAKDINLNEVVAGLQLQLLTYLDAVCNIEDVMPAGVLYFTLMDPSANVAKGADEAKIEAEIRKQFKMKGLILADVNMIKKMDKSFSTGYANMVPAYINTKGEITPSRSSTITRQQFENLQKYTNKIIKQIANNILEGNIQVKPYYKIKGGKTPCEYCKYKSICNFNTGIGKKEYTYIGNAERDTILEQMKEKG